MKFTIAIEPGTKKEAFGVVVPDLPGCFSAGDTTEEAFENARQAIEVHCEELAAEGKDLPTPRPISEWQADKEYRGWTWGIVEASVDKLFGPAEKINITMSPLILRRIDNYAVSIGESRSSFLAKAAEAMIRNSASGVEWRVRGSKHSAKDILRGMGLEDDDAVGSTPGIVGRKIGKPRARRASR